MRVVHIEAGRHLYGGAAQVLMLLEGLRAHKGEHHCLVCAHGSAIASAAADRGLAIRPIALRGEFDILSPVRIARALRRENADLVHVHSRRGVDFWGGIAAKRLGLPTVLSRRVDNPETVFSRRKYRYYDRVVAISAAIADLLVQREGLARERVVCIPSAVDTERFHPLRDRNAARAQLCARLRPSFDHGPILAIVAQLIERKGHRTLLEALPRVQRAHPDVRLIVFGRGPLRAELAHRVDALGLGEAVVFAGLRDDMPELLPGVDLLVHPAFQEGLGVALLEAAACGVPIVAGRAGGIPEIVREGENGRLFTPGDVDALAEAIVNLLDDRATAQRFGQQGRRIVLESFSIERMARDNHRVYTALLAQRDGTR